MSNKFDIDKELDEALSKSPSFELPMGFSEKVIRRIEMKKLANDRRTNFIVMLASFCFLLLAAICFVLFANNEILKQMFDFGGWVALIGVMVVLIQVLDNWLVKRKMSGSH